MNNNFHLIIGTIFLFSFDWTISRTIKVGPCILVLEDDGDCPDPDYIKVYLFTRKNLDEGQYVAFNNTTDNITLSNFDPEHSNKLIIHGYYSDMFLDVLMEIKSEYLRQEEANVWMVDYPKLVAGTLCYPFAVHNIQHVGHCLAPLVTALRRHSSPNLHVIGFSLGAHVANFMANKIGVPKINRITGLDPAGPGFISRGEHHRLDVSDADFVDVVHTNGLVQGIIEQSGHVDFYMNGGVTQPGCVLESNPFACDHHRAATYFAESIRSHIGFLGWQCAGYIQYLSGSCRPQLNLVTMGESCPLGSRGFYLVYTAAEKPFALGNWTGKTFKQRSANVRFAQANGTTNTSHTLHTVTGEKSSNVIQTVTSSLT